MDERNRDSHKRGIFLASMFAYSVFGVLIGFIPGILFSLWASPNDWSHLFMGMATGSIITPLLGMLIPHD